MRIPTSVLRAAGVDRAAWRRYAINPYGDMHRPPPARPRSVICRGGPLADTLVSLYDPQTGTLPLRGGRYRWVSVGRTWESVGYLEWQEEAQP